MRSWGRRRAGRRLAGQVVEVGTGGVRTRVSFAPEVLKHRCRQKVSVKCEVKSYQYCEERASNYLWPRSTPRAVRVSGQEASEKTGHSAEGGDGGVGCAGNFPGDRFADDGK
jgi:hypothetical protein